MALQRTITKLSIFLVFTVFASSSFAQVRNLNDAERKAIPVENYTGQLWLGTYVADNAPDALYELFVQNPKYALYAKTNAFGKDFKYCTATIGITEATGDVKRSPRLPTTYFTGAYANANANIVDGEAGCYGRAIKQAASKLFNEDIESIKQGLARTKNDSTKPNKLPKNTDLISHYSSGITNTGKSYLRGIHPDWFPQAIDYRHYTVTYQYSEIKTEEGETVCLADYGITSAAPAQRNPRHPLASIAKARLLKKSDAKTDAMESLCFDPLWNAIISEITIDSKLLEDFVSYWSHVAEPGIPAPSAKNIIAAHNNWGREQERKAQQAERQFQKSTARNTSNLTCSNECYNGSCTRTFSNGRKEQWQAPRIYNPLTSNWEWDISTNACGS